MGNPVLDPETALQLFSISSLYCVAYIFGGPAVIGLAVYIVLLCSEVFFSQPRSKTQRAKASQSALRVPVAKESLDLSAVETPTLAAPERLRDEAGWVTGPPHGAQIPMTVPANLESEPSLP